MTTRLTGVRLLSNRMNTMATSNEEVVEMLTRSSAAMSAANNSLAETIALESAAVQITRNAETTGTAFRTISMRINNTCSPIWRHIGKLVAQIGETPEMDDTEGKTA